MFQQNTMVFGTPLLLPPINYLVPLFLKYNKLFPWNHYHTTRIQRSQMVKNYVHQHKWCGRYIWCWISLCWRYCFSSTPRGSYAQAFIFINGAIVENILTWFEIPIWFPRFATHGPWSRIFGIISFGVIELEILASQKYLRFAFKF